MKGHVEIVNAYDHNYWNIFVDGILVFEPRKESFNDYVFKRSARNELAKKAGVLAEDLRYTVYDNFESDLEEALSAAGLDYDGNDYDDYSAFTTAVATYNLIPSHKEVSLDVLEEAY